jgi:transcriptional regulator with XRE-family HTH domain
MKSPKQSPLSTLVRRRIRQLRDNAGLTQERLCELAGISSDAISRIEGGVRVPRLDTLEKLARVFDTDVSSLVSSDKEPEPATYPPSIMRIVYLLLQYPPQVHEVCENLLKSALDGFLGIENARVILRTASRKKPGASGRGRGGKPSKTRK